MKEIMAIVRMNMVNHTKKALLEAGYPSITVRKVMGRGKKKIDFSLAEGSITPEIVITSYSIHYTKLYDQSPCTCFFVFYWYGITRELTQ